MGSILRNVKEGKKKKGPNFVSTTLLQCDKTSPKKVHNTSKLISHTHPPLPQFHLSLSHFPRGLVLSKLAGIFSIDLDLHWGMNRNTNVSLF